MSAMPPPPAPPGGGGGKGGHSRHHRAAPAATPQPRAEVGGRGPGDNAGPGDPREGAMEARLGAESGGTRRSVQPRPPGAVLHAVGTRSCLPGAAPPLRGWGAQRAPLYGDAGEQLVQPRAERMRTLCPRRCPALPGVLLQLTAHGHAGPVAGQPDLWGNLLPCRGATPSSRPLPAPSSIFCFREAVGLARGSCGRATGLVATGPKGQGSIWLQGTAGYWPMAGYKRVPWCCLTAGTKRRDGRPPCWLTG